MHFLLAGKVLLSLETQTEMSMEYDSTECEFWCQIAKVRSTEQFVGLTCKQRDTHSWENVRGCACTEQRAFLREYVTTVTTMSSEGAKSACLVVWLAGHKATKKKEKQEKGNVNQATRGKPMPFPVQKQLKGNANRATQRITLLLKPVTN